LQPCGTTTVERALDALSFFLADMRDGLGPSLAICLLIERKWDEASIGPVMSITAAAIDHQVARLPRIEAGDATRGIGDVTHNSSASQDR